jgi:hypothetical protein
LIWTFSHVIETERELIPTFMLLVPYRIPDYNIPPPSPPGLGFGFLSSKFSTAGKVTVTRTFDFLKLRIYTYFFILMPVPYGPSFNKTLILKLQKCTFLFLCRYRTDYILLKPLKMDPPLH